MGSSDEIKPFKAEYGSPSKFWYVIHLFFGIISGIACYLSWRNYDSKKAKWHLIHSVWIGGFVNVGYTAMIILILVSVFGSDGVEFIHFNLWDF